MSQEKIYNSNKQQEQINCQQLPLSDTVDSHGKMIINLLERNITDELF